MQHHLVTINRIGRIDGDQAQLLTTVVEDFGQPRWATPEERAAILQRVFDASYWEYPQN